MKSEITDELDFLADLQERAGKSRAELMGMQSQKLSASIKVDNCITKTETLAKALEIAQAVAQGIQEQAHEKIAGVVTSCLQMVFDKPYVFKIIFTKKRGRTEAELVFMKNGMEVDPLTASGGGVVDVAAFALRISCITLHKPVLRRTVLLDEPFKFVSAYYRDNVKTMLLKLASEFGMQFIMVTHIDELITGKVIKL